MSTIIKQTLKNKANDGHSSNSTDKGVLMNDSTLQRKDNKSLKSERISRFLPCHDDVVSYILQFENHPDQKHLKQFLKQILYPMFVVTKTRNSYQEPTVHKMKE